MATSIVDVCNIALGKLGAKPIISLTDGSAQASLCNTYAQQIVDEVLSKHLWNCATFRATLTQISGVTNPMGDDVLQQCFALPTNPYCLRVLDVDPYYTPYTIESVVSPAYTGRVLWSSETSVSIIYIGRQTDFTQMHPALIEAMAALLAAELAYPLTEHQPLADLMAKKYEGKLAYARSVDSQEGSPVRADINDLVNARVRNALVDDFDRNWRIAQ